MRQEVSAAIETLVASRTAMEPYPDVEALCEFFQYTQDLASYESLKSGLLEERETEKLAAVHRARENFQKKSARLREMIAWDWSPLWQVLAANDTLYSTLPETPWSHDGNPV